MGFRGSNVGKRDTRITVHKPQDPGAAQGFYDEDGKLVDGTDNTFKIWARVMDKASIGPIIGGKIQNEVELGLMADSRSTRNIDIRDTITTDRDGTTLEYEVVDIHDTSYRFTSMIMVKRTS